MVVEIPLTQGYVTLVDDEDAERIAGLRWYVLTSPKSPVYAARAERDERGQRHVLLHRAIVKAPKGIPVDHINRDSLDNRRSNLRLATTSQNGANRSANAGRRFKGVTFDKSCGLWRAQIQPGGRGRTIGRFKTEEEAARAYDDVALELWGDFANLNFPLDT